MIPQPKISAILNEHFVCLAADCDAPEPEVMEIGRKHMPRARMLPFCLYLDGDGNFLHGSEGALSAWGFQSDLETALEKAGRR